MALLSFPKERMVFANGGRAEPTTPRRERARATRWRPSLLARWRANYELALANAAHDTRPAACVCCKRATRMALRRSVRLALLAVLVSAASLALFGVVSRFVATTLMASTMGMRGRQGAPMNIVPHGEAARAHKPPANRGELHAQNNPGVELFVYVLEKHVLQRAVVEGVLVDDLGVPEQGVLRDLLRRRSLRGGGGERLWARRGWRCARRRGWYIFGLGAEFWSGRPKKIRLDGRAARRRCRGL